jgi:epoxyqueuosine reductase
MPSNPGDNVTLKTNPQSFFDSTIKEYIANSPNNIMPGFDGEPIWDEPLVGYADGDDPIFQEYKEIIGQNHPTPREAMNKHLKKVASGYSDPLRVSVISYVLPTTSATILAVAFHTLVTYFNTSLLIKMVSLGLTSQQLASWQSLE